MSRTTDAYDRESRAPYREWKASLTWREYPAYQWRQWSPMVAGMVTGAAVMGLMWLATR